VGQKVHPYGFRLGTLFGWQSNWFAGKNYAEQLHEDLAIRKFIKKKLYHAGISKVVIERTGEKVVVNIHTARPGILIGKRGAEVETLRKELAAFTPRDVFINIKEIRKAELDAQLVAVHDEVRCQGHPHPVLGPPGRRRDGAARVVPRRARPAAHAAR
jgi:small subunit ribosomal protein S3